MSFFRKARFPKISEVNCRILQIPARVGKCSTKILFLKTCKSLPPKNFLRSSGKGTGFWNLRSSISPCFRKIALRAPWVVPGGMFVTVMRRGLGFGRREFWDWGVCGVGLLIVLPVSEKF
jgi:hypothetical protein